MSQLNPTDGVTHALVTDVLVAVAQVNRESAGIASVTALRPGGIRSRPLHRVEAGTAVDVLVDEIVDELRVAAGSSPLSAAPLTTAMDAASRRFVDRVAGLGSSVASMHGRRVPHSLARIPHLVVGASGVFVVHVERAKNDKVRAGRSGRLFGAGRDRLLVSGEDRTTLVEAVRWQVGQVRAALAEGEFLTEIPVQGLLCVVDAEFPVRAIDLRCVEVRGLSATTARLAAEGQLDEPMRERIAAHLARYLPPRLGR